MKHYEDYHVVCPFYRHEEQQKIFCDGFTEGTRIRTWFRSNELKSIHKKNFCVKVDNYVNCPLYPAISKQYEEEKDEQVSQ